MKHFFILLGMLFCVSLVGQQGIDFNIFTQKLAGAQLDTGGGGGTVSTTGEPVRDGTGQNENAIKCNWPKSGSMAVKPTWLRWDDIPDGAPYKVLIRQGINTVFENTVNTNGLKLDLQTLGLESNKDYTVKISSNDGSFKTNKILVDFKSVDQLNKDLIELDNFVEFQNETGVVKQLMKAFYLNKKGWNFEASEAYNIPTSTTDEMQLIVNMFADFKKTNF